jgi:hypothetical protein
MPGPESSTVPQSVTIHGFEVHPTVNANGTDAGGAKTLVNGIEYRVTRGGHFFTKATTVETHPWQDFEEFLATVAGAVQALKRYQQRRETDLRTA